MDELDAKIAEFDRERAPFQWTIWDVLIITAGFLFLTLLGGIISLVWLIGDVDLLLEGATPEPSLMLSLLSVMVNIISFGGPVLLLIWLKGKRPFWKTLDVVPMSVRQVSITIAIGFIGMVLVGWTGDLVIQGFDIPFENPQIEQIAPDGFTWTSFVAMLIFAGLLVPFAEELYFRGVLFRWLRQMFPFWVAALISSALFGALHLHPVISVATGVLGFVAAFMYERIGSLWAAFIIHAFNNIFSVIALYACLAQDLTVC